MAKKKIEKDSIEKIVRYITPDYKTGGITYEMGPDRNIIRRKLRQLVSDVRFDVENASDFDSLEEFEIFFKEKYGFTPV